jgi:ADP-heptose:LPS heptosyltransferase
LHQFFPESEISVLVRKGTEAMLQNNPLIKEIFTDGEITSNQRMHERTKSSVGRRLSQIPNGLKLLRTLRREKFDLAIDFTGSDRGAILAFFSRAKQRVCYHPKGGFRGKGRLFTELCSRPAQPSHKVSEYAQLVFHAADVCGGKTIENQPTAGRLVLKPWPKELAWAEAEWQ